MTELRYGTCNYVLLVLVLSLFPVQSTCELMSPESDEVSVELVAVTP